MRKMLHCALALVVALTVLLTPSLASALEASAPQAMSSIFSSAFFPFFSPALDSAKGTATLVIRDPSINFGPASVDIKAEATISAGVDSENQRGFLTFDLDGNGTKALNAVMAMEDGKLKGYMQSGSAALPYLLEIPLSELNSFVGNAGDPQSAAFATAYVELMAAADAYGTKLEDPAYSAALTEKIAAAVMQSLTFEAAGSEEIEIFGEKVTADKTVVHATYDQAVEMIDKILGSDEDLKAFCDQYLKVLSTMAGEDMTATDLVDMMKAEELDADYEVTIWQVGDVVRFAETMKMTTDGKTGTVGFNIDVKSVGEDTQLALSVDTNLPDEKPAGFTLDASTETAADGAQKFNMEMKATEAGAEVFAISVTGGDATKDGVSNKTLALTFRSPDEGSGTITYTAKNTDATATAKATDDVSLTLDIDAPDIVAQMGVAYTGEHYQQDDQTIYDGNLKFTIAQGSEEYYMTLGTTLTLGSMPEGALLTDDGIGTLDPITATEEQQAELQQSLMEIMNNAAAVMMQVPGVGLLFGSMMDS